MVYITGVRFKRACKVYDFNANGLVLKPGDNVIVEVEKGLGMGTISYVPREVDPAALPRPLKRVVRKAEALDMERHTFNSEREEEAYRVCKDKIQKHKLPMKLIRVEYLFDSSKAIFYFTSETRVDFRELVKELASGFHTRIEMRQVGVRDEAKLIGGLGPCGRELCCSGFLSDFAPVTIKMAKDQNLALNPAKISGICGRLMCCLGYEHEMYKNEKRLRKAEGEAACGGCHGHAGTTEKSDGSQTEPSQAGTPSAEAELGATPQEIAENNPPQTGISEPGKPREERDRQRPPQGSGRRNRGRQNRPQKDSAGPSGTQQNRPQQGGARKPGNQQNRSSRNRGRQDRPRQDTPRDKPSTDKPPTPEKPEGAQ